MSIVVRSERCPQDHPCPVVRFCPVGAIGQNGFQAPEVKQEVCVDCGRCLRGCPYGVFVSDPTA